MANTKGIDGELLQDKSGSAIPQELFDFEPSEASFDEFANQNNNEVLRFLERRGLPVPDHLKN